MKIAGAIIVSSLIFTSGYVFIKTGGKKGMCWLFWAIFLSLVFI